MIAVIILYMLSMTMNDKVVSFMVPSEDVIIRPEFGAYFRYEGILDDSHSYMTQTIIVPNFSTKFNLKEFVCPSAKVSKQPPTFFYTEQLGKELASLNLSLSSDGSELSNLCQTFERTFKNHNEFRRTLGGKIKEHMKLMRAMVDDVELVLPKSDSDQRKGQSSEVPTHDYDNIVMRTKRTAPFAFIAELQKWLTGVPTGSDFESLYNKVLNLESHANLTVKELNRYSGNLNKYSMLQDTRVDSIIKALKMGEHDLEKLMVRMNALGIRLGKVESNMLRLRQLVAKFVVFNAAVMDTMVTDTQSLLLLENFLYRRIRAIQTIYDGQLSADLVPPSQLAKILRTVSKSLLTSHPAYTLAQTSHQYYYNKRGLVKFIQCRSKLYIDLKIPLTTQATRFKVYAINVYKIPAENKVGVNSNHSTKISTIYTHIGFSPDYYVLSDRDISLSDSDMKPSDILSLHEYTAMSCPLALFTKEAAAIRSHCSYELMLNTPADLILTRLDQRRILLVNPVKSTWVLSCPDRAPKTLAPSLHAIITQRCQCNLRTIVQRQSGHGGDIQDLFLPASISMCNDTLTTPIVTEPENALVLHTLLNFSDFSGDGVSSRKHYALPDLNLTFSHAKYQNIFKDDAKIVIDLHKARDALFSETFDYVKPPSSFSSFLTSDTFQEVNYYLVYCNSVFIAILAFLMFNIYARNGQMGFGLALMAANRAPVISPAPVEVHTPHWTIPPFQPADTPDHKPNDDGMQHLILMIIVAYLAYRIARWAYRKINMLRLRIPSRFKDSYTVLTQAKSNVLLELSSPEFYLRIPVTSLPHPPAHITARNFTDVKALTVNKGLFRPTLAVHWGEVNMMVLGKEYNLTLPSELPIPIMLQSRVARLVATAGCATRILVGREPCFTALVHTPDPPTSTV
jgi:hypothetical protein